MPLTVAWGGCHRLRGRYEVGCHPMNPAAEMFYFAPRIPPPRPPVRHYRRKRTYPTKERVLVHLSAEGLRPRERGQDAVASATKSGRSTLTKWLGRLEDERLVVRERVRIEGHRLPKYAYYLTDEGWTAAARLRERLGADVVTLQAPHLGPLSVRLAEIPTLAASRLDLTSAVSLVEKERIDLKAGPASGSRPREPLVWRTGLRQVDHLFGREEELQSLDAWYDGGSQVLVITGLPGIGKSALVAGWIRSRRPGVPVYAFELHRSTTPAALLADFGAFLAALGKPGLAAHLAQGDPLDLGFVRRLLERDLARMQILAIFDNADRLARGTARLLGTQLLHLLPASPARVILVGRRPPTWLDFLQGSVPSLVELRISGLGPGASTSLLRYRGLGGNPEAMRDIVRTTRGHPLLLHLAASGGASHATAVRRYLEEEVWDTLTPEQRRTLETASVLRRPAAGRLLASAARVDRRVLDSLTERNLLERTVAGGYLVHDLVRSFLVDRMDARRARILHERVAALLLGSPEPKGRWEGVFHLLAAGKTEAVAQYLDSDGAPLLDSVAAEEIAAVVRSLPSEAADPASSCVFSEILGDSLRIRGHVGPALQQYQHARAQAEERGRDERIPRLLRKMANLERCRNRYPEALGHLVEAQARLLKAEDTVELTEVLREMALVEEAQGDFPGAAKHLNDAIDLAAETSDRGALSRGLLTLGSLESQHGQQERGLGYDREALRVAERSGDLTEVARAHIVLGVDLARAGQNEASLPHYSRGLEIAQLLGNLRLTAYATLNRASTLLELRRYKEAGGPLKEAEGYFAILEEKDTLAFLKTYEGQREVGLGHWTRGVYAWEQGLQGLRMYATPADLAHVLVEISRYCLARDDSKRAESYLSEARVIAEKLGDVTLLSKVEGILAPLGEGELHHES